MTTKTPIVTMTKAKAEEILRGADCTFIRRHAGHDSVDVDGELSRQQLVALTWLMTNCPDWSIGV